MPAGIPVTAHHLAAAQKLHNAVTQPDLKDSEYKYYSFGLSRAFLTSQGLLVI